MIESIVLTVFYIAVICAMLFISVVCLSFVATAITYMIDQVAIWIRLRKESKI